MKDMKTLSDLLDEYDYDCFNNYFDTKEVNTDYYKKRYFDLLKENHQLRSELKLFDKTMYSLKTACIIITFLILPSFMGMIYISKSITEFKTLFLSSPWLILFVIAMYIFYFFIIYAITMGAVELLSDDYMFTCVSKNLKRSIIFVVILNLLFLGIIFHFNEIIVT